MPPPLKHRFRTCICEQGPNCNRPICFFAHCEEERRPLPEGSSDPSTLPGGAPSTRASGGGGGGGGSGGGGGGGRHNRPGATAMVIPAINSVSGVMYSPNQALLMTPMAAPSMVVQQAQVQQLQQMQQLQPMQWPGDAGAGGGAPAPVQVVLQPGPPSQGAGGGSTMVLSTSPALSGASNLSYNSLSALRSHTPSPSLVQQGSGPLVWQDSQLLQQDAAQAAAASGLMPQGSGTLMPQGSGNLMAQASGHLMPQGSGHLMPSGEDADAILSFSLWDGPTADPGANAALAAAQQQVQQQQQQLQRLQQQVQQQQQQQAASRSSSGGMFGGFESWSPMHSPLGSPHAGHSGAAAAAMALAAAAAAASSPGPAGRGGGMISMTRPTPSSTSASTTPTVSPANSSVSGTQYQGVVLGQGGLASLAISGPRCAASPRPSSSVALVQDFPTLVTQLSGGSFSGASAPLSGSSTPRDAASMPDLTELASGSGSQPQASPQGMAAQLLMQQVQAHVQPQAGGGLAVDALAQDLSNMLSVNGLRALSAKLAAMADQAEQRGQGGSQGN